MQSKSYQGTRCSFYVQLHYEEVVQQYKDKVGKKNFSDSICKLIEKEMHMMQEVNNE